MLLPTDYRQRVLKQEKTRQYKAMLDDQIRQNYMYNQQRANKRNNRLKTDPIEIYDYRSKINSSSRQLPHQSSFLPNINSSNVIDHGYRYGQSSGYQPQQSKRYVSLIPTRKQSFQRQNDQEMDDHLQKCLEQCDHLINGINKNFIHLNNHLRTNPEKKKPTEFKNAKQRNHSDFDMFAGQPSANKLSDSYPVTNLRGSQLVGYDDDVGRNQMMNYNLLKSKEKFSYFSPEKKYHSPFSNRDGYDNSFDKGQQKTKRKNPNDLLSSNTKLSSKKNNNSSLDFETINSDERNEDMLNESNQLINSKSSKMAKSMSKETKEQEQKKKQEKQKKIKEEQAALQEMKKKDNHIIEHLRKAKNRGNILFKKIQVFKKQRQELELSDNSLAQNLQAKKDSKTQSRNSQSATDSKKSLPADKDKEGKNPKQSDKNIQAELRKEDISVNSPKKQQSKKETISNDKSAQKSDKRADSKISQKSPC